MSKFYDILFEERLDFVGIAAAVADAFGISPSAVAVHEPFSLEALPEETKIICYASYVEGEFLLLVTMSILDEGLDDGLIEIAVKLAVALHCRCLVPKVEDANPCTMLMAHADGRVTDELLEPDELDLERYVVVKSDDTE